MSALDGLPAAEPRPSVISIVARARARAPSPLLHCKFCGAEQLGWNRLCRHVKRSHPAQFRAIQEYADGRDGYDERVHNWEWAFAAAVDGVTGGDSSVGEYSPDGRPPKVARDYGDYRAACSATSALLEQDDEVTPARPSREVPSDEDAPQFRWLLAKERGEPLPSPCGNSPEWGRALFEYECAKAAKKLAAKERAQLVRAAVAAIGVERRVPRQDALGRSRGYRVVVERRRGRGRVVELDRKAIEQQLAVRGLTLADLRRAVERGVCAPGPPGSAVAAQVSPRRSGVDRADLKCPAPVKVRGPDRRSSTLFF